MDCAELLSSVPSPDMSEALEALENLRTPPKGEASVVTEPRRTGENNPPPPPPPVGEVRIRLGTTAPPGGEPPEEERGLTPRVKAIAERRPPESSTVRDGRRTATILEPARGSNFIIDRV